MKAITPALAVIVGILGVSGAWAKPTPAADCMTVSQLKASLPKNAKFTPLNIGQFHFVEGVYVATPPASPPPAADNALLVRGASNGGGIVIWMKAECAVPMQPTQVTAGLIKLILAINPVAGETSDADDSKDELHL